MLVSSWYGLVSEICCISSKVEGTEQAKLFVMLLLFQPFLGRFVLQRKESLKSFDGCLQLFENIPFCFKFDNFCFMGAK